MTGGTDSAKSVCATPGTAILERVHPGSDERQPAVPLPVPVVLPVLVDAVPTPTVLLDHEGGVVHANAAWTRLAGPGDPGLRDVIAQVSAQGSARGSTQGSGQESATAPDVRRPESLEARLADGRWVHLDLRAVDGGGAAWWCAAMDIDDLHRSYRRMRFRHRHLRTFVDGWSDSIVLLEPDGRPVYMNAVGRAALGLPPDTEVDGDLPQQWPESLSPAVRAEVTDALRRARAGESVQFLARRERAGDRSPEVWDHRLTPSLGEDGEVAAIVCVSRDVSSEVASREALVEARERLTMATVVGGIGIWDFDLATRGLRCDDTWHRIMGRAEGPAVTTLEDFRALVHPEDVEVASEVVKTAAAFNESGEDYTTSYRVVHPDGAVRWVRSAACLVTGEGERVVRAVGFVVDITEEVERREALQEVNRTLEAERAAWKRRSLEDPLTGLPNRRALLRSLTRICAEAEQSGRPFCVVLVDVDRFKAYNDRYGHVAGDTMLGTFADCLREVVRRRDVVARYGGEEFVLVLTDTDDPSSLLSRLYDRLDELRIPHQGSPSRYVTISAGCAVFTEVAEGAADHPELLIDAADQAMYRAKADGRDRFVVRMQ